MQTTDLHILATTMAGHRNITLSTVGYYAANDGKFFVRIAEGGGCTLKTAARVVDWFSDNWPDDLAWPHDIPRPAKPSKAA